MLQLYIQMFVDFFRFVCIPSKRYGGMACDNVNVHFRFIHSLIFEWLDAVFVFQFLQSLTSGDYVLLLRFYESVVFASKVENRMCTSCVQWTPNDMLAIQYMVHMCIDFIEALKSFLFDLSFILDLYRRVFDSIPPIYMNLFASIRFSQLLLLFFLVFLK